MKKLFSLGALLMLAMCAGFICSCNDDVEETPPAGSNTADNKDPHEYVDLGLPSGTLWATCNVGANSPEEYGNYFAWGETKPKSDYTWGIYKYCQGSPDTMTKYCRSRSYGTVDNKTELEPSDDAATANWGGGWQMPSREQFNELFNSSYTATTWTTLNGVSGYEITSKSNGNSIFCRLQVGATVRASTMQVATATTGRVRSVRATATALINWASIPAISTRAAPSATSAGAFAPSV